MRVVGLEIVGKSTCLKGFTSLSGTAYVPLGVGIGILTSDNTNVANNATVTIGNKTYTFKTALTPTEGEVLIGADADASLLNLIRAINHTGTPDTDYKCAAAHTQVAARAAVASHTLTIVALDWSVAGSTIALSETSTHLAWDASTLTGGPVDCNQILLRNDSGQTLELGYCDAGDTAPDGLTFLLPTAKEITLRGLRNSRQLLIRRSDTSATAVDFYGIAEAAG